MEVLIDKDTWKRCTSSNSAAYQAIKTALATFPPAKAAKMLDAMSNTACTFETPKEINACMVGMLAILSIASDVKI